MIDVPINNNQQASLDEDVDDGVHGVWVMLQVKEQHLFEGVELSLPCKQWNSEAIIIAPICI